MKCCLLRMPAHSPNTSWLAGKVLQNHCNQPPTLLLASHPPSCLKSRLLTAAVQLSVASAAMTGKPPCIHPSEPPSHPDMLRLVEHPHPRSPQLKPLSFCSHSLSAYPIAFQWLVANEPPAPHPVLHSFFPCSSHMKLQISAFFSTATNWEKRKSERERERDKQSVRVAGTPHN